MRKLGGFGFDAGPSQEKATTAVEGSIQHEALAKRVGMQGGCKALNRV